ncbi:MAG TPA: hypothetical protein DCS66_07660 [Flavobacteriaceae bacterium]|nr:hypothetical protein [Flavobacteriaceae bacterium]|tara:strand:- start:345 stop:554 length:210 start_codon:yes stop_codon:yes gene_type:complete
MFKITNKKTGFSTYLNANETATFMFRNDVEKYTVKEIRTIDYKEIFYGAIGFIIMIIFSCAVIYFATNE